MQGTGNEKSQKKNYGNETNISQATSFLFHKKYQTKQNSCLRHIPRITE